MKKSLYYFGSFFVIVFVVLLISYRTNTYRSQNMKITNAELEALYESIPGYQSVGVCSDAYTIKSYDEEDMIHIPLRKGPVFVSTITRDNDTYDYPLKSCVIFTNHLGKTIRFCYGGEPFFQISDYYFGQNVPVKLVISESRFNKSSFFFISGQHDSYGDVGGIYVNGRLLSQRIIFRGGAPFVPRNVKKVGKNMIIKFINSDRVSLYALFNEKTGSLILPINAEEVENNHKSMKKHL